MKKLLALTLCAVMLLGMIPMAGAASFKDSAEITQMSTAITATASTTLIATIVPVSISTFSFSKA